MGRLLGFVVQAVGHDEDPCGHALTLRLRDQLEDVLVLVLALERLDIGDALAVDQDLSNQTLAVDELRDQESVLLRNENCQWKSSSSQSKASTDPARMTQFGWRTSQFQKVVEIERDPGSLGPRSGRSSRHRIQATLECAP